jgi:hypothetical protein
MGNTPTWLSANLVRRWWRLKQSDGSFRTVSAVSSKPLGGMIRVTYADGSFADLPVNTQVFGYSN